MITTEKVSFERLLEIAELRAWANPNKNEPEELSALIAALRERVLAARVATLNGCLMVSDRAEEL